MSTSESSSAPPAKDTSSSSTSTPAKSPRANSKVDQPPSKSEKTSKTPSEKSGGEEKPRDLRRSLDGSASSSKGTKIQITRKRYVLSGGFCVVSFMRQTCTPRKYLKCIV